MKFKIKIILNSNTAQAYKMMLSTQEMVKWESNFSSFQIVSGAKRKLGSIGQRIYKEPDGTKTKIKEEITAIKKNQLLAYQLTHKNFLSYVTCQFLDQGNGTTVLLEETDMKFRPAIVNIIGFFMKGNMKKKRTEDLHQFKKLIERK